MSPPCKAAPAEALGHPTALRRLPLVTVYLTDRCNSRCVTCDYWRQGRTDVSLESIQALLPELQELGTQVVLVSGGEPLLNAQWPDIAASLKAAGLKVWLLTSGLALAKHARRVAELFDAVTVSLDGTNRTTYSAIRGLDAFDKVCEGVQAAAEAGVAVGLRVTLQRSNYRELLQFIPLALQIRAHRISFLAVDVANPHAFARNDDFASDLALRTEDLEVFAALLDELERESELFRCGFIEESPAKLRRLHQYFAALCGRGPFPTVRCNAPELSAVIGVTGRVQPCFFIPGPLSTRPYGQDLAGVLNSEAMVTLRQSIRAGERAECITCVCSLWRDPLLPESSLLPVPGPRVSPALCIEGAQ